jgi:hypothetical protein
MTKIAITYAYFEKNDEYKLNLNFFIKYGYIDSPDIDYIFVINGSYTTLIPNAHNVTIIQRENKGYDFAGYHASIKSMTKQYDYYFFLNGSVRGPFMPSYTYKSMSWIDAYLNLFKDNIKLVGSTINALVPNYHSAFKRDKFMPHVQSCIFCMDHECLNYLLDKTEIFKKFYDRIDDVVLFQEVAMSSKVLENGWNISCLVHEYQNRDYSNITKVFNHSASQHFGDILHNGACFGRTVHPYEIIFIKTNRGIAGEVVHTLTNHLMHSDMLIKETLFQIPSAWKGHYTFAHWLCGFMNPDVTVELGVDYGFSFFTFLTAKRGTVYGIDWFKGDPDTGFRNTFNYVNNMYKGISEMDKTLPPLNLITNEFTEEAKTWDKTIDILHIDGGHSYENVKSDFTNWYPKVREGGVILLHDIAVDHHGVSMLFNELTQERWQFKHSAGLGIVIKGENKALSEALKNYPQIQKIELST